MPEQPALKLADLPIGTKKTVTLEDTKILIVRTEDLGPGQPALFALEAECPHAKAPLEKGAVCNGRLVCPFHAGTFELATGALLEPPPLRDLKRYPVRLSGEDILVDPTPIPASKPAPTGEGKHLVFAGGGAATAAALAYLRDASFAGTVTVLDPVMDEPIDRTQLTKAALTGKTPLAKLPIFAPPGQTAEGRESLDALKLQRIKAHLTTVNPDAGTFTAGDRTEAFDALMLATGGVPKRLQVPGADLPHVFTIRHSEDLQRMASLLGGEGEGKGKHAVLIGDSFIAFEAASALKQRGLEVTVLSQSELPFANKFGPVVAQALLGLHKTKGVTILANTEAAAITEKDVELKDAHGASRGDRLPADVVITAIGVEPVVDYADAASGIKRAEKGGLAVGRDLRVAAGVWAAGDIAAMDGTRIEHWRLAEQHGRTVAAAMLASLANGAEPEPFAGVPLFWTTHFGKRFNYAGHAESWDRIEYVGDPMQLDFMAFYVKDNEVAAVLECGRDTALAGLMGPLRQPLSLEEAKRLTSAA